MTETPKVGETPQAQKPASQASASPEPQIIVVNEQDGPAVFMAKCSLIGLGFMVAVSGYHEAEKDTHFDQGANFAAHWGYRTVESLPNLVYGAGLAMRDIFNGGNRVRGAESGIRLYIVPEHEVDEEESGVEVLQRLLREGEGQVVEKHDAPYGLDNG